MENLENYSSHSSIDPMFSVVIPAYNAEMYIRDSIASVLAQTLTRFELIVVDDGSTDRTSEVVGSFSDARVKLVQRANGGLAAARNSGVAVSKGELVAFLDADDRWLPGKLAAHEQVMNKHPEVSVTYDWAAFIDEAGLPTGLCMSQSKRKITHQSLMIKNYLGNGSTAVVRRSVLEEFNGFDEKLMRLVDRELWVRLTYYGHTIQLVPAVLTEYRQHSASFTANRTRMLKGLDEFFARIFLYAPESVKCHAPLAKACMRRWMARAAFVEKNYDEARSHMQESLRSSVKVLWCDPRAPITFVAIALQSILPDAWFDSILAVGTAIVSRWFGSSVNSEQQR